jgi:hypothetical protein
MRQLTKVTQVGERSLCGAIWLKDRIRTDLRVGAGAGDLIAGVVGHNIMSLRVFCCVGVPRGGGGREDKSLWTAIRAQAFYGWRSRDERSSQAHVQHLEYS